MYHWAWGAKPGTNDPISNLYIELFGRDPDQRGFDFWTNKREKGLSLDGVRQEMMTFPEWERVCYGDCKPVMPEKAVVGGQYYEYDKENFMNKYAISPLPMSNVLGTDGKGDSYSMEWDVDFPYDGNYTFIVQCDLSLIHI